MEALHFLQVCRVCKKEEIGVPADVELKPSAQPQLSGQPQQFFDQFRQGQFPLPPRLAMPPGT